jgi:hypothetical protein
MSGKAPQPQCPLLLRFHRLMDAFAKSDDERDFYLDRAEGFLVYVDLDKSQAELDALYAELEGEKERYIPIPKLTFYESKKIMEGFVHEKVYDIDTKEKLLDIIGSKAARDGFLEFLHDHHAELEKWQQYYQERSRVRIIEWLRKQELQFVFEEDVDLPKSVVENVKQTLFQARISRDIAQARKALQSKAATYYSSEALNPRPKRGRPPKQQAKIETEPQITEDFYQAVSPAVRPFLYTPDITALSSFAFSGKFQTEEEFLEHVRTSKQVSISKLDELSQKIASLKRLTARLAGDKIRGIDQE